MSVHWRICIFEDNSAGSMCKKGFSMVNPVHLWYSCKQTESVLSVRAWQCLRGLIGPLLMGKKKVCFLTLVNQLNGPLGGRSRVPNGLIRGRRVMMGMSSKGKGTGRPTFTFRLQLSSSAPRPAKDTSSGSMSGQIYSASSTSTLALWNEQQWNVDSMSR